MIDGGSVTSWKESDETLVAEKALVAGDHDENAPTASTLRRADNTAIPKILRACLPLFPSPSRFILSFCFVIENRRTQFCVRELVVVVFCGRKRFRTALIHSILDFAENKWIKTKFFRYGVSGCMRQNGISCILGHWRFFCNQISLYFTANSHMRPNFLVVQMFYILVPNQKLKRKSSSFLLGHKITQEMEKLQVNDIRATRL